MNNKKKEEEITKQSFRVVKMLFLKFKRQMKTDVVQYVASLLVGGPIWLKSTF